jgi:hypothetical protein
MSRRVVAWLVAVAVTGALVVGGMLVASDGPGERPPAVLPALQLGDEATAASQAAAAGDGGPAATGRAATGRPDVAELPAVSYRVRGTLPELPDRARAWTVGTDLAGGRLAALAAALGLRGQPRADQSGWTATGGDRRLRVDRQAGLPWRYGATLPGCKLPAGAAARGVECLTPDVVVGGPAVPLPKPCLLRPAAGSGCPRPFPPSRLADLPSRQDAERTARDLAGQAGLDLAGASVRVTGGYAAWVVRIDPAVGGQPTSGFSWSVSVGPKGRVTAASGWLATPQPADSYPLIGVAEGVERLKRQPGGLFPSWPRTEAGKRPLAPAKRVLTVTGARLGLQLARVAPEGNRSAGVAYLLPAYLFDVEGDWLGVRAVIAVQDRYLTTPPPTLVPQGRSQPAPAP